MRTRYTHTHYKYIYIYTHTYISTCNLISGNRERALVCSTHIRMTHACTINKRIHAHAHDTYMHHAHAYMRYVHTRKNSHRLKDGVETSGLGISDLGISERYLLRCEVELVF